MTADRITEYQRTADDTHVNWEEVRELALWLSSNAGDPDIGEALVEEYWDRFYSLVTPTTVLDMLGRDRRDRIMTDWLKVEERITDLDHEAAMEGAVADALRAHADEHERLSTLAATEAHELRRLLASHRIEG